MLKNRLIILCFLFALLFLLFFLNKTITKNQAINTVGKLPQKPSCNQDLSFNELDKDVKSNKTVMDIINTNCLWVLEVDRFDVTGDGNPELIINTSDAGCASCHNRLVYILDGEKVIFEKKGDDMRVNKSTFPINGFQIHEPLRRHDEAMCCSTEGLIYTYIYSPKDDRGIDESVHGIFKSMSSLNTTSDEYFYFYDTRSEIYKKL